jgi:uncharacterized protein YtpQ (UPF0354 family)
LAARLTARIRELLPDARVEQHDASELRVWPNNGKSGPEGLSVFLDNVERECTNPRSCDDSIERVARGVATYSSSEKEKLALESILPTLKSADFVSQSERLLKSRGNERRFLSAPVVDDLVLVLVLDLPTTTRFLNDGDLSELGLTLEQLQALALENLRRRPRNFTAQEVAPGLFGLTAGDGYDAALFLLHDEWHTFKPKVRGELVVAPVGRDMVFVTGDREQAALSALGRVLENERSRPHVAYPITTRAYRWTVTGWSPFEPR